MNIVNYKPLDWWKSCSGLCVICGTPMGIEPERKLVKENYENEELIRKDTEEDGEEEEHFITGRGEQETIIQVKR